MNIGIHRQIPILGHYKCKFGIYILKYPILAVENWLLAQNKNLSEGVKICMYIYMC